MKAELRRRTTERMARASMFIVGALPWLVALLAVVLPAPATELLGSPFALVCHRRPERSLELLGHLMPVCSRCAGLFGGGALGATLAWPRLELRPARRALALAALLLILDVVTQDIGLHPVWHASRIATGGLFGYLAASTLVALIRAESRSGH